VEKAEQDKQSIIIKAQAEAKSAELIGASIANNPGFVQLRRLDTAREIAHTIAESSNQVYLPSDALMLNLFAALDGGRGAAGAASKEMR